jgi:hypothetical protein
MHYLYLTLGIALICFLYYVLHNALKKEFPEGVVYIVTWIFFFGSLGLLIRNNPFKKVNSSNQNFKTEGSAPDAYVEEVEIAEQEYEVVEDEHQVVGPEGDEEEPSEFEDGEYCAEVIYFNENTGTRSSYRLTVEVEDLEVIVIQWPNGGWLDHSHFCCAELDEDGYTSFTSDKGYQYQSNNT